VTVVSRLLGEESDIITERQLQLLLLANVISTLGNALISPILGTLTGVFHVTPSQIGLMVTAISAPGIAIIPISGFLTDRYGRKPVLVSGLLLFGCGGVAIAFTTDFQVVLGLRFLQGIGFAGTVPVAITAIGDIYSSEREAAGQGFRLASSGFSQTVFPPLSGLLALVSWTYPFLIYSIAIPIAAVTYVWFTEPTEVGADSPSPQTGTVQGDGVDQSSVASTSYLIRVGRLAVRPRVAAILIANALMIVPWIAFFTYNSLVVIQLNGFTSTLAGLLVAVFSTTFAIAASQAGRLTRLFDGRTVPLVVANTTIALGLGLFVVSPGPAVMAVSVFVLGIGIGVTGSMYRSLITGFAPAALRGGLVSLNESLGRLSATLTPIILGYAITVFEVPYSSGTAIRFALLGTALFSGIVGVVSVVVATYAVDGRQATL